MTMNDEESSSMSCERYTHLCDIMQMGNKAFRDSQFEQAINSYRRANSVKPGDLIILINRCRAYLWISHFLKTRPRSASDYSPLSGLDATTHAKLALKDAEKVMNLQSSSVTSYILKANALLLLERYEQARYAIFSGFQIDPHSIPLQNLERITAYILLRGACVKPKQTVSIRKAIVADNRRLKAEPLMPSTEHPELFSFWLGTLTKLRPSERWISFA